MSVRPLYGGAIRANEVGAFVKGGLDFAVIHPGYDAQGRRRTAWTQVVFGDVPIWEAKIAAPVGTVLRQFDDAWDAAGCEDAGVFRRALDQCVQARRFRFRDGRSGEAPAQAVTRDGRGAGKRYSS